MKYLAILVCAILIIGLFGCGTESVSPDNSENTLVFDQYVWFDTSIFLARYQGLGGVILPEPVLNREQSLGEPFNDINDNGVFDIGIDEFIMCDCPQNMDFDDNGRYTGPDEPWAPGIPFDDINGNGIYDDDPYDFYDYSPGKPFADYNENGVWDEYPEYSYTPVQIVKTDESPDSIKYTPETVRYDSLYFTSDSGIVYGLSYIGNGATTPAGFGFIFKDSGLYFSYLNEPDKSYGREFFVIDTGEISSGTEQGRLVNASIDYILYYDRTINTDYELEVGGITYSHLLHIRFDNPVAYTLEGYENTDFDNTFFDFYFSESKGFIGYRTRAMANESDRTYFYDLKIPSKNITMIK